MKFRILVKQNPGGVPIYYPQFRGWGLWWYYLPFDEVLKHCGFMFRADAERFLMGRHEAHLRSGQTYILPWKPYQ